MITLNDIKDAKKRLESTENYINGMFGIHSKINVLRVDVGYTNEFSQEMTIEDLNKDINHILHLHNAFAEPSHPPLLLPNIVYS